MTAEQVHTSHNNDRASGVVRSLGPVLGILAAGWILVYGLVLEAPGIPLGALAFLPALALGLLVMTQNREHPRRWLYALAPAAFGLIAASVIFGMLVGGGATAWWIVGAIVVAVPFLLAAAV